MKEVYIPMGDKNIKADLDTVNFVESISSNTTTQNAMYEAFQDDVIATFHTVDEMNRYLLQSLGEEDG